MVSLAFPTRPLSARDKTIPPGAARMCSKAFLPEAPHLAPRPIEPDPAVSGGNFLPPRVPERGVTKTGPSITMELIRACLPAVHDSRAGNCWLLVWGLGGVWLGPPVHLPSSCALSRVRLPNRRRDL